MLVLVISGSTLQAVEIELIMHTYNCDNYYYCEVYCVCMHQISYYKITFNMPGTFQPHGRAWRPLHTFSWCFTGAQQLKCCIRLCNCTFTP